MASVKQYDLIVIGAGISGLSLAHFAAQDGKKVLVLEKEEHIGGALHSHNFGRQYDNYWLEMGAHTCYNSYSRFISILEDYQAMEKILARRKNPFMILADNQPIPIGKMLSITELMFSLPKMFFLKKDNKTVAEYYSSLSGKGNYQRVVNHLLSAVPSQRADDFPADMLFKKRSRRKDVIRHFTLEGGLQTIAELIAANKLIDIVNSAAFSVEKSQGLISVISANNNHYRAPKLAMAANLAAAKKLLQPISGKLSSQLGRIGQSSVESLGILLSKDQTNLPLVNGLVGKGDDFYSMVSRDTIDHESYRGFTFHFGSHVVNIEQKMARAVQALELKTKQPLAYLSKAILMPSFATGHRKIVENIDSLLKNQDLMLTGNYFNGMAIEDCVQRSYQEYQRVREE